MNILSLWPWPRSHSGGNHAENDSRPISTNMSNINETLQGFWWWYSYINLNTNNFDFFHKISKPWPWPQGHPRGGDGADKNCRPISTIMPNMNEIHQRVFIIWGPINFNAKTLTLWRKDEWTNVRTNERTDERKAKTLYPRHTSSYVGSIINHDRRTALERSVKSISLAGGGGGGGGGGAGLNRFYVATILVLTSAAV